MKSSKLTLLAIAGMSLAAGAAFAQTPSSNTSTVTSGLVSDNLVDSFDTGVDGKKIIFFAGYGMSDNLLQLGYGQRFGEKFWLSVYDGWFFNANTLKTETATSDAVAHDGVNTDYTDKSSSASLSGSERIKNNFALSTYIGNKIGGTFYWNTDRTKFNGYAAANPTGALSDTNGTTSTKTGTESHEEGTESVTEYSALANKKSTDTFGISFNGVGTPKLLGEREFYFKLNSVQLALEKRYINLAWAKSSKLNGSDVDGEDQPSYKGTYSFNKYTPSIELETGLTFKKLWDTVTPSFALSDGFDISFRSNKNSYDYTRFSTNDSSTCTTEVTDYSMSQGEYSNWNNTLTPQFTFDFDLGEKIILKAKALAGFTIGDLYSGADSYTTTVTSTSVDKLTGDKTVSKTVTNSGSAVNTDIFETSLTPAFSLGFEYKIVPEKFNFNLGVSASAGTFTWTKKTTTNSYIAEKSTSTFTNEAGETTVTASTYTPANGDGTGSGDASADKQENTFSCTSPSATARLGFTWLLADKAQLDTYLLGGTSSGSATPTWAMNVMFGFKF